jgi:hypothetical protein
MIRRKHNLVSGQPAMPMPESSTGLAVVINYDAVAALLAEDNTYCIQCGEPFPILGSLELSAHLLGAHADRFLSAELSMRRQLHDDYAKKTPEERKPIDREWINVLLATRPDLFSRCRAAGAISIPRKEN